jgi:hypothetical protein
MVSFLMSIESSYEYKTWNLNIPGFFYDDIFTTNFYKIPLLALVAFFLFFSDRSVF